MAPHELGGVAHRVVGGHRSVGFDPDRETVEVGALPHPRFLDGEVRTQNRVVDRVDPDEIHRRGRRQRLLVGQHETAPLVHMQFDVHFAVVRERQNVMVRVVDRDRRRAPGSSGP